MSLGAQPPSMPSLSPGRSGCGGTTDRALARCVCGSAHASGAFCARRAFQSSSRVTCRSVEPGEHLGADLGRVDGAGCARLEREPQSAPRSPGSEARTTRTSGPDATEQVRGCEDGRSERSVDRASSELVSRRAAGLDPDQSGGHGDVAEVMALGRSNFSTAAPSMRRRLQASRRAARQNHRALA